MPTVSSVKFNLYSGPRIVGTEPFLLTPNAGHWEKVLWLTAQVESGGRYGSITMYDGTAVTAGLHQAIAVYPKELVDEDFNAEDDQGSFWKLLKQIELVPFLTPLQDLFAKLKARGWYVGSDGSLRYLTDGKTNVKGRLISFKAGDLVFGYDLREEFTPNSGTVPSFGPLWDKSKSWALAFYRVFSDPKSFPAQVLFGSNHFSSVAKNKTITAQGHKKSVENWLYAGHIENFVPTTSAYDLALSVFWSHSVNAPSIAYSYLAAAIEAADPVSHPDKFASLLLRLLGRSTYGRWNSTENNGRWKRTRSVAQKIWSHDLFENEGCMPSTL